MLPGDDRHANPNAKQKIAIRLKNRDIEHEKRQWNDEIHIFSKQLRAHFGILREEINNRAFEKEKRKQKE